MGRATLDELKQSLLARAAGDGLRSG